MGLWKEIGIGHLALKVLLTCTTTMDMIKFNDMQNLVTNFNKLSIEDLMVYGIVCILSKSVNTYKKKFLYLIHTIMIFTDSYHAYNIFIEIY